MRCGVLFAGLLEAVILMFMLVQLILTSRPRLIYIDPIRMKQKGT